MGRMKDTYTEMQEMGLDPNSTQDYHIYTAKKIYGLEQKTPKQVRDAVARKAATRKVLLDRVISQLGDITDLPESMVAKIRQSNTAVFDEAVQQKFQHAKSVLLQKHKDYGPKNISQSPGGPLNGLRVRMWDKMARINNLIDTGATPEHESLKDSFLDLANYAIIAMLVLDNEWPNE
jgi:hypothetical protein